MSGNKRNTTKFEWIINSPVHRLHVFFLDFSLYFSFNFLIIFISIIYRTSLFPVLLFFNLYIYIFKFVPFIYNSTRPPATIAVYLAMRSLGMALNFALKILIKAASDTFGFFLEYLSRFPPSQ